MKVLMVSLDESILEEGTESFNRLSEYSNIVDQLLILIPSSQSKSVILNGKVTAVGITGFSKASRLVHLYYFAKRTLKKNRFDLITSQDTYYLGFCARLLSRKFHIPLELQVHGFEKLNGIRLILTRFLLKRASNVRTVSKRSRQMLIDVFRVKEEMIYSLPVSGKDVGLPQQREKKHQTPFTFLTVGRLVPVKNIEMQIRAIVRVSKENPQIALWIVGDGPERENLEKLVTSLGVKDKVKFWGQQDNPDSFYPKADVFVLTSKSEGWGRVVIEAAAHSLPIIMTDVGLAGEFLLDEQNGKVISIDDEDTLVQSMERFMNDKPFANLLGIHAKDSFEALPTRIDTLKQQGEFWNSIMEKKL